MSADPLRVEVKTIQLPSAENEAFQSCAGLGRNGLGSLPSAAATKISALSGAKLANAIVYAGVSARTEGMATTHASAVARVKGGRIGQAAYHGRAGEPPADRGGSDQGAVRRSGGVPNGGAEPVAPARIQRPPAQHVLRLRVRRASDGGHQRDAGVADGEPRQPDRH